MNNDYERYDFWHREMNSVKSEKSIKSERSMAKLINSNKKFDEKNQKGFKYNPDDRSEDMPNITQLFI
jgi:hypothetical protein